MQRTGFKPNQFTYANMITTCVEMGALQQGIDIHQSMKDRGFSPNVVGSTTLVDMYAKNGSIDKACELFHKNMPQRNEVSWNSMIAGYIQPRFFEKAFKTFKQMQLAYVKLNSITFVSILRVCTKIGALEHGMDIHQRIIEGGGLSDVVVTSALKDMYAKCRSMAMTRKLFDKITQRNVVSLTAIIGGYTKNGYFDNALEAFKQMQLAGVKPKAKTLASILLAYVKMGALE